MNLGGFEVRIHRRVHLDDVVGAAKSVEKGAQIGKVHPVQRSQDVPATVRSNWRAASLPVSHFRRYARWIVVFPADFM